MSSYLCKCDTRMDFTNIPADCSYHLVSDIAAEVQNDLLTYTFDINDSSEVLKCPSCGRLWVFLNGMAYAPTEYEYKGIDQRTP